MFQEFDPRILDQCTMFVDGNFQPTDVNNTQFLGNHQQQQQFFVLPADQFAATSTKTRVSLLDINGDHLNHASVNSHHQPNIRLHHELGDEQQIGYTFNGSTLPKSNQVNYNTNINANGQQNGSTTLDDLHTDV